MVNRKENFRSVVEKTNIFIKKHQLDALTDVALFILITLVIHYSYRFWANQLHYAPVKDLMMSGHRWLADQVYIQSIWLVDHVLGIDFTSVDQNSTLYFPNNGYIAVNRSCSGFKQILQFALLMMVYPGSLKQKFWYIPLGIVIVHITNLFRITGLSVVIIHWPAYWDFSHDYLFRPFFYVVIFSLWVLWVERISRLKTRFEKTKKAE
jgi:exosortase/archaeosortase family protein